MIRKPLDMIKIKLLMIAKPLGTKRRLALKQPITKLIIKPPTKIRPLQEQKAKRTQSKQLQTRTRRKTSPPPTRRRPKSTAQSRMDSISSIAAKKKERKLRNNSTQLRTQR